MIINLVFEISCICAGILLAITSLDKLDGKSNFFNNIAAKLKPFNAAIGFATLIIGILYLIKIKCLIFAIIGIACGLLLLPQQLAKAPVIGGFLLNISKRIQPIKIIIGDAAIILGLLGLLGLNPFCGQPKLAYNSTTLTSY